MDKFDYFRRDALYLGIQRQWDHMRYIKSLDQTSFAKFSQETDACFGSCFFTLADHLEPCDLQSGQEVADLSDTVLTLSGQHGSFWMTTRRKELPPSRHPRKIATTSVRCLVFHWANAVTHQFVATWEEKLWRLQ